MRAGLCLQQTASRRWLIFGYFSTATPSAMARVFQAYGCRYAMQLDINALEHTYLALYVHTQGRVEVQHLVQGMADVDRKGGEQLSPRFLGFPDDRDFFYLRRRGANDDAPCRIALSLLALAGSSRADQAALAQRNELMFQQIQQQRGLSAPQMQLLRDIFARSGFAGQGNPAISEHPQTPEQCRKKLQQRNIAYANARIRAHLRREVHGSALRSKKGQRRDRPRRASISSSIRTFRALIRWSGSRRARRRRSARPKASGYAMRTNGKAPAPAIWKRRTTASTWRRA